MEGGAGVVPATAGDAPRAVLERLELRDFRNFGKLDRAFPPAGVAIVGPNGSGKTNLLEAIYYLEIFRSFRGSPDGELVRFGAEVFRASARVGRPDGPTAVTAAYSRPARRKKVTVDGDEPARLVDAIGTLGAVVFSPEDVEILRGSPSHRRRFLDIVLALVVPGYADALQRYRAILGQRNEALRAGSGAASVAAWTPGLVRAGAVVMAARARWVESVRETFRAYHAEIAGGPPGEPAYRPALDRSGREAARAAAEAEGDEVWAGRLDAALGETEETERRRGMTVVGPHRDDLVFRAAEAADGEPRDLRAFGSGGQLRTAAIALRLVEADSLRARKGWEPVYLLDDVFAELDRERSERVVRLLDEGRAGQVILTAPRTSEVPLRGGSLEEWRIENGRIV